MKAFNINNKTYPSYAKISYSLFINFNKFNKKKITNVYFNSSSGNYAYTVKFL